MFMRESKIEDLKQIQVDINSVNENTLNIFLKNINERVICSIS